MRHAYVWPISSGSKKGRCQSALIAPWFMPYLRLHNIQIKIIIIQIESLERPLEQCVTAIDYAVKKYLSCVFSASADISIHSGTGRLIGARGWTRSLDPRRALRCGGGFTISKNLLGWAGPGQKRNRPNALIIAQNLQRKFWEFIPSRENHAGQDSVQFWKFLKV
jgi:hypothetical protein